MVTSRFGIGWHHERGWPFAAPQLAAVRASLAIGIERAFVVGTVLAALGVLAALFLPEIPLRGTIQDHPTG